MGDDQYYIRKNPRYKEFLPPKESPLDCTLVAEGKYYNCHKSLVSAYSPYLAAVLRQRAHEDHPVVVLDNVRFYDLMYIMSYMYLGEVKVPRDQERAFSRAAGQLQIKGLLRESEEHQGLEDPTPLRKSKRWSQRLLERLPSRRSSNPQEPSRTDTRPLPTPPTHAASNQNQILNQPSTSQRSRPVTTSKRVVSVAVQTSEEYLTRCPDCNVGLNPHSPKTHSTYFRCQNRPGWELREGKAECKGCGALVEPQLVELHVKHLCGRRLTGCVYCEERVQDWLGHVTEVHGKSVSALLEDLAQMDESSFLSKVQVQEKQQGPPATREGTGCHHSHSHWRPTDVMGILAIATLGNAVLSGNPGQK